MTSPFNELDDREKDLQQQIKSISNKFNEFNRHIRDLKSWLLATKKAINVVSHHVELKKKDKAYFKKFLIGKITETKTKLEILFKHCKEHFLRDHLLD